MSWSEVVSRVRASSLLRDGVVTVHVPKRNTKPRRRHHLLVRFEPGTVTTTQMSRKDREHVVGMQ